MCMFPFWCDNLKKYMEERTEGKKLERLKKPIKSAKFDKFVDISRT